MGIAFFDLDKTLIAVNSAKLWVRAELRAGHIGRLQALVAAGWMVRYGLGAARLEDAVRSAVAALEGEDEATLRARTHAFFDAEIARLVRPGANRALAEHRAAGEPCVLLTSSSAYMSEKTVALLELDAALCNTFEVRDGVFTGKAIEPLCFGPGKVDHARRYASARGVDLADCAFYTDSASDSPLLELVGRPRIVDPDPRLKRRARKRGWPEVDWGTPPGEL